MKNISSWLGWNYFGWLDSSYICQRLEIDSEKLCSSPFHSPFHPKVYPRGYRSSLYDWRSALKAFPIPGFKQIVIQIGDEVDGVAMVRCASNVNSSEHLGKESEPRLRETLCPLKYLQEVWPPPSQRSFRFVSNETHKQPNSAGGQQGSSTSGEKYYDCMQCGEECRHVAIRNWAPETGQKQKSPGTTKPGVSLFIATRKLPQTPAKKRSSLARPVRVHDAFVQPKIMANYYHHQPGEHPCERFESSEAPWPARIRLEETVDQLHPLPQFQNRDFKRSFKDTEKLLKVFGANNVDQDLDSVKRCSLM